MARIIFSAFFYSCLLSSTSYVYTINQGIPPLETIRSFDVFDTLIGRIHKEPISTFNIVEKTYPFPNFSKLRIQAEQLSDGTFDGIYRNFAKLTGLTNSECLKLQEFEFQTDLHQMFPIQHNINQVSDGDILVSDTYYGHAMLLDIIQRLGIDKKITLYSTPNGKASGQIWSQLLKKHQISSHLGDNVLADVTTPAQNNIKSIHYLKSQYSLIEQTIQKYKLSSLANIMRCLRLMNPYPHNSIEYSIWNEQAQYNVPILVLASIYLDTFCKTHKKNKILFSTRGCCLWLQIFSKMFPEYSSHYFHASRYIYYYPTYDYITYVRSIYSNDSVIVDENGRGKSCAEFFKKYFDIHPSQLIITLQQVNSAEKLAHGILRATRLTSRIEVLNLDNIGSLINYENHTPIRLPPEYDVYYIEVAHSCVKKCLDLLDHFGPELKTFRIHALKSLFSSLPTHTALEKVCVHLSHHNGITP